MKKVFVLILLVQEVLQLSAQSYVLGAPYYLLKKEPDNTTQTEYKPSREQS
jgi:hypothetical protein